jgi:hypothetical protein
MLLTYSWREDGREDEGAGRGEMRPRGGWSGSYRDKKSPSEREREKWVAVGAPEEGGGEKTIWARAMMVE